MIEWIVSGSVLIGIVFLLRAVLNGHISMRLRYLLWLPVLIRLLLPVQLFQSSISVQNLVQDQPAVEVVRQVSQTHFPRQSYMEARQKLVEEYRQQGLDAQMMAQEDPEQFSHLVTQRMESDISLSDVLTVIWLLGSAVVLMFILLSNLNFHRRAAGGRIPYETDAAQLPVYLSAGVTTPCLVGVFRPVIYLTEEAAADQDGVNHVLKHEMTHYRHKDHWIALARCVALALHWYNPLVWMAAHASRQDAELACDEATIATLGEEERLPYGHTLIRLTRCRKSATGIVLAGTALTHTKRTLKQRIRAISRNARTTAVTLCIVVLVAAVAVGCTFTGARNETAQPTEPSESIQPSEPAEPTAPADTTPTTPDGTVIVPIDDLAVENLAWDHAEGYFAQRLGELSVDGYTAVETQVLGMYPADEDFLQVAHDAFRQTPYLVAADGRFLAINSAVEKVERMYFVIASDGKEAKLLGLLTQLQVDSYRDSSWPNEYMGALGETWNAYVARTMEPTQPTEPPQPTEPEHELDRVLAKLFPGDTVELRPHHLEETITVEKSRCPLDLKNMEPYESNEPIDAWYMELVGEGGYVRYYDVETMKLRSIVELYDGEQILRFYESGRGNPEFRARVLYYENDMKDDYEFQADSLEEAIQIKAEYLIYRHLDFDIGSPYFAHEAVIRDIKVTKQTPEENYAEFTVSYYLRQEKPATDGYTGAVIGENGPYEGWLWDGIITSVQSEDGYNWH